MAILERAPHQAYIEASPASAERAGRVVSRALRTLGQRLIGRGSAQAPGNITDRVSSGEGMGPPTPTDGRPDRNEEPEMKPYHRIVLNIIRALYDEHGYSLTIVPDENRAYPSQKTTDGSMRLSSDNDKLNLFITPDGFFDFLSNNNPADSMQIRDELRARLSEHFEVIDVRREENDELQRIERFPGSDTDWLWQLFPRDTDSEEVAAIQPFGVEVSPQTQNK